MATNLITGYGQITATELDEAYIAASPYGFLSTSPKKINFASNFANNKKVIVRTIDVSGLGDYDKSLGYPQGSATEIENEYMLAMDRGRLINLDVVDGKDAGLEIGKYLAKLQKKYVVPETVAYISQKLYALANANSHVTNVSLSVANVIASLATAINDAQDIVGEEESLVCLIPRTVKTLIETSTENTHFLNVADFKSGAITTRVKTVNDVPVVPINSNLFYSGYDFLNGVDPDQYNGGFSITSGAVPIQYIIMPMSGAQFIKKTENIRTFSPEVNQRLNAWQADYRIIYDLISTIEQQKSIIAAY